MLRLNRVVEAEQECLSDVGGQTDPGAPFRTREGCEVVCGVAATGVGGWRATVEGQSDSWSVGYVAQPTALNHYFP